MILLSLGHEIKPDSEVRLLTLVLFNTLISCLLHSVVQKLVIISLGTDDEALFGLRKEGDEH